MAHDDDIPPPDAPETPAESAKATSFSELVDGMLSDAAPPPALNADDRALLETATLIRAGSHDAYDLPAARRDAIIEDALGAGAGLAGGAGDVATDSTRGGAQAPEELGDELARRRALRLVPWVAAAAAAAAALFLWLRPPDRGAPAVEPVAVELPAQQRSRPADALIGRIGRDESGAAAARIDQIFADRSTGYRAVRFRRLGGEPGGVQ